MLKQIDILGNMCSKGSILEILLYNIVLCSYFTGGLIYKK